MKTKTLILTTLVGLTLAACSSEDRKKGDNLIDNDVQQAGLEATWKSGCVNASLDLFGLAAQTEDLQITNDIRKSTKYFKTNACETPSMKVEERGSYSNFNGQGENWVIDINYEAVEVTPLSEETKDLLNTIKFCGIEDWAVDTTRDVTAQTSDNPIVDRCWTKTPRGIYDLWHIDGNNLQLGQATADLDKTAPEKRPDTIDTTITFTK